MGRSRYYLDAVLTMVDAKHVMRHLQAGRRKHHWHEWRECSGARDAGAVRVVRAAHAW